MNSANFSPVPPLPPPRSISVTAAGWIVIVLGSLLTPISVISCMMILVGGHGTASVELSGVLMVVVGPPATVVAGIGLLLRRRWAWVCLLALSGLALTWNGVLWARGPAAPAVHLSREGVPTTVVSTGPAHSVFVLSVAAGLLIALLTPRARAEFVRRPAPPEPAASRPKAIVTRRNDGPVPPPRPGSRSWTEGGVSSAEPTYKQGLRALLVVALVSLGVAGGMTWLVLKGLQEGASYLPRQRSSPGRTVARADDPALFWTAIGLWSVVGLGAAGIGGFCMREAIRLRPRAGTDRVISRD